MSRPLPTPPDQDLVVFGASGDLARRKLLPALYNLEASGLLPVHCTILGLSLDGLDDAGFRALAKAAVLAFSRTGLDPGVWDRFARRLRFRPSTGDALHQLGDVLTAPRRVFYLAVPPSAFDAILEQIRQAGLQRGGSVIIEKPFGHDLVSARALNRALHQAVPEERVFRIDHYLGKETVQNLLVFRFGNTLFQRIWNRDVIDHVQLTVAEDIGVEDRGPLYEETGAIRDVVQNHLFQLLALTCMGAPTSFAADALRDEKVKVLRAIRPIGAAEVVRGQYTAGLAGGERLVGYREVPGVAGDSTTETYAALLVHVDTWEWAGIPFYLRTGKALLTRRTEIVLRFRDVPLHFFQGTEIADLESNRLTVRIQPEEGISLSFNAKQPGPQVVEQPVRMNFTYGSSFKTQPAEAYERLLHDVFLGDHTLFIREDETEAAWAALQPVLEQMPAVQPYPAGSQGPAGAAALVPPPGWHDLRHHAADRAATPA
ncbi:MAG TPA: glucose-6-phosphate dehydrogenase [Candidatus Micrarchaeia archaeon]|nr:glucose-6-phosphate dehydrogenase [Candidatus Micrarchaeia archaeon]